MDTLSPEQRELRLVESVEFKILGVANQEDKLHELLQRYLAPLILKAASEQASVRARVLQISVNLRSFIQPPTIVLPVKTLLVQYKSSESFAVKQLDLAFILHSLDRLDADDRLHLIPIALHGIAADAGYPREPRILNVALRLLLDAQIPLRGSKKDEAFRQAVGLSDAADAEYLARAIGVFLRLRTPIGSQTLAQSNPALSQQELSLFPSKHPETQNLFDRLSELKAKLVTFLASGAFTDSEKFMPALYAASGSDNRAAMAAEEIIKRSSVSMEEEALVKNLFSTYDVSPAACRTRILSLLAKSAISTTMTDSVLGLVRLEFTSPATADPSVSWLQPSSDLERTKLFTALFQYLSWVSQVGASRPSFTIGHQLIGCMRDYIEEQGWPIPGQTSQEKVFLRSKAYETIGLVARAAKLSFSERMDHGKWLFRSLSEDPTNGAVVDIDGALSGLTVNWPSNSDQPCEGRLQNMLLTYISLPDTAPAVRSTRHAVVRWANRCLPFSDLYARWIDILAIAGRPDERRDVVEEGQRGLDPWTYFSDGKSGSPFPDWRAMIITFFDSLIDPSQIQFQETRHPTTDPAFSVFRNFAGGPALAFPVALRYCQQIMLQWALKINVQPDSMEVLRTQARSDVRSRDMVRALLQSTHGGYVICYLRSCLEGAFLEDSPIVEECIRCFVEVAYLSPEDPLAYLLDAGPKLCDLIRSGDKKISRHAAKALALLAGHPANPAKNFDDCNQVLFNLFTNGKDGVGSDLNAAQGALLTLGYVNSRAVYYDREFPRDMEYPLYLLFDEPGSSSLTAYALKAFGHLWPAKLALPPADGEHSIRKVIEKLSAWAKKSSDLAIVALGNLAVGLDDAEDVDLPSALGESGSDGLDRSALGLILKGLFSLHELGNTELQFYVGDSITAAIGRWESDAVTLRTEADARGSKFFAPARTPVVEAVIERLLRDSKTAKFSHLKAYGIWFYCLVRCCSHLTPVQSRLREIQAVFIRLLASREEMVQRTVSRGLITVYEEGNSELKSALVKDLVSSFTGSGKQLKVEEDTGLNDLPPGEGSPFTSYKDIVRLANEVGDPKLVYKFMSLAASSATWAAKAYRRFGLRSIICESDIDPKVYTKLYRYRFDPNPNVKKTMNDIWKALVKDSSAILDEHFEAILEDLLKCILSRERKVREASCAAILNLVEEQPFKKYEKYYGDIWSAALKVLDDVETSKTALNLYAALSKALVQQLEEGSLTAAAKAKMEQAMPILLSERGVESSVQAIQVVAMATVMDVAKRGGKALRPFIPDMIPQLLGILSIMEPQNINYDYQRVGEDGRDEIDRLRSQMVKQSPISEAIEKSLRFADAEVIAKLGPQLETTIKNAIGLPTKLGCCRVLWTLATRHAGEMASVSSRLLKLLEKQVLDKNDEASQAYARAAAYVMRTATDAVQRRYFEQAINKYLEAEDDRQRRKTAYAVVAVAKLSPDHFTAHETKLMPFLYLGSYDTEECTRNSSREVWDQHAGSSRTVKRYMSEIVVLAERWLDTTQWSLRHTAALAVAAMIADVEDATDDASGMEESAARAMWPVLDKSLVLKTFAGKEKLLESYPKFVKQSRTLWRNDEQLAAQMKKIAVREAKRNNDEYRIHAFRCLWRFAKARDDIDMLQEIIEITTPYLKAQQDEDKIKRGSKDLVFETAKSAFEAVARGYSESRAEDLRPVLRDVVSSLGPYLSSPRFDVIKREVWYDCVCDLMGDIVKTAAPKVPLAPLPFDGTGEVAAPKVPSPPLPFDGTGMVAALLESLDVAGAETGTEAQRLKRAKAVSLTAQAKVKGVFGGAEIARSLEDAVEAAMREERSPEVQKAWRAALDEIKGGAQ